MEFIDPDPDAMADIREKGASVDADRICETWKERTEDIRRCASKNDPRYRLLRECVRIFTFGNLVRLNTPAAMRTASSGSTSAIGKSMSKGAKVESSDGGVWMNNVALKIGLCRDLTGDGVPIIPAGVSLIVSNGLGAEPCHELALAIIRDCLVRGEIGNALVFSRMKRLKSRLLTFAEGVETGGCFNGWSVKRKDILSTINSMGRDGAWIDGNSLQYHESELIDEVRRELGFFGEDLIMLDLGFPDFGRLDELRKIALKMKRRIIVTTSFPFRTGGGNLTLPVIEVAAQMACGRGIMELTEAVACIQNYQTGSTDSDVVVEVLKGQFLPRGQKLNKKTSESRALSRWHGLC